MVKINVNDKGECHVFVRGDWDQVRHHLLVAATKVRTMAADTRKFAKAASGKTPLATLTGKDEQPTQAGRKIEFQPHINGRSQVDPLFQAGQDGGNSGSATAYTKGSLPLRVS